MPLKLKMLQKRLSGELVMTLNGKPIEVPESEKKKWETEIKEWQDIAKRL